MDRLGRFVGELITIDGKVGVICGKGLINGWRRGEGNSYQEFNPCNARTIFTPVNKDSHYRFAWKDGSTVYAKIISGRGLIPANDYVAHTDARIGAKRKMSFISREIAGGLVGRIISYEFEQPAIMKRITTPVGSKPFEEIQKIYPEQNLDYREMKFYEGLINFAIKEQVDD